MGQRCQTPLMAPDRRKVWILVGPGTGLMNLCGVWEVLSHANDVMGRQAYECGIYGPIVPSITTGHGLIVGDVKPLPHRFRQPADMVVVAGGSGMVPPRETDLQIADWLRKHAPRIDTIVSICAGAFTLGEAGLLDGRRATTHWMVLDRLAKRYPLADVVDEGIYVRDGPIWTSAGITAGIDLCLALVERDFGHHVAMEVAQRLVLFLKRSGNQAQFSAALRRQREQPEPLAQLTSYVIEHIDEDLGVPRLARALGMSARTLSRWCRTHLDEAPAEVVRRLRIEEAARHLSSSTRSLKEVAALSGIGDPSTLWRLFVRKYGVTPEEYRERFSSALMPRRPSVERSRSAPGLG